MALKLEKFNKDQETWQRFVQRVGLYFISAGIAGETAGNVAKRRAILLQGMGVELFNRFCDSAGGEIDEMDFDQIVAEVETLVNPKPMEVYERYRFHNRAQQPGETAADYMVALRKIALSCNFAKDGENNADPTKARLRDQFVCGLTDKLMQQHLLQQETLTIDNCVTLAQSFESAAKTTNLLRNGNGRDSKEEKAVEVNAMRAKAHRGSWKGACGHCGRVNDHPPKECRFRNAVCHKCQGKGHIRPVCPEDSSDSDSDDDKTGGKSTKKKSSANGKAKGGKTANVGQIYVEKSDSDSECVGCSPYVQPGSTATGWDTVTTTIGTTTTTTSDSTFVPTTSSSTVATSMAATSSGSTSNPTSTSSTSLISSTTASSSSGSTTSVASISSPPPISTAATSTSPSSSYSNSSPTSNSESTSQSSAASSSSASSTSSQTVSSASSANNESSSSVTTTIPSASSQPTSETQSGSQSTQLAQPKLTTSTSSQPRDSSISSTTSTVQNTPVKATQSATEPDATSSSFKGPSSGASSVGPATTSASSDSSHSTNTKTSATTVTSSAPTSDTSTSTFSETAKGSFSLPSSTLSGLTAENSSSQRSTKPASASSPFPASNSSSNVTTVPRTPSITLSTKTSGFHSSISSSASPHYDSSAASTSIQASSRYSSSSAATQTAPTAPSTRSPAALAKTSTDTTSPELVTVSVGTTAASGGESHVPGVSTIVNTHATFPLYPSIISSTSTFPPISTARSQEMTVATRGSGGTIAPVDHQLVMETETSLTVTRSHSETTQMDTTKSESAQELSTNRPPSNASQSQPNPNVEASSSYSNVDRTSSGYGVESGTDKVQPAITADSPISAAWALGSAPSADPMISSPSIAAAIFSSSPADTSSSVLDSDPSQYHSLADPSATDSNLAEGGNWYSGAPRGPNDSSLFELLDKMNYPEESADGIARTTNLKAALPFLTTPLSIEVQKEIGIQWSMTFVKCYYVRSDCLVETDFRWDLTAVFGSCFTFNFNDTAVRMFTHAGPQYGLSMTLYTYQEDFICTTDSTGFKISLQLPTEAPFPETSGIYAMPGVITSTIVSRVTNLKRDDCIQNDDLSNYYYDGTYTVEGCMRSCHQKYAMQQCGCADPRYPKPAEERFCGMNDMLCLENFLACNHGLLTTDQCSCKQVCRETQYSAIVTTSALNFDTDAWIPVCGKYIGKDWNGTCQEYFQRSIAMVNIYYDRLSEVINTEEDAYPTLAYLSDLFSWMGISYGICVGTVVEIGFIALDMIAAYIAKTFKRGRVQLLDEVEPREYTVFD